MSARAYFRGHEIINVDGQWVYADTLTPAGFSGEVRPCKKCGKVFNGSDSGQPDPCLGNLPGVDNACCGHGIKEEAYVRFTNGVILRGFTVERCENFGRTDCYRDHREVKG